MWIYDDGSPRGRAWRTGYTKRDGNVVKRICAANDVQKSQYERGKAESVGHIAVKREAVRERAELRIDDIEILCLTVRRPSFGNFQENELILAIYQRWRHLMKICV